MNKTRWKSAPAGMGYGFAFNDHLQALTAAAEARMGARQADQPAAKRAAPTGKTEKDARLPAKP
jgi:hypothetical protein